MRFLKRLLSREAVYYSVEDKNRQSPPLTESLRNMLMRESQNPENNLELFGVNEHQKTAEAFRNLSNCFTEKHIHHKIELPLNHPDNLDIAVENGFRAFCSKSGLEDADCILQLALAFTEYLQSYHHMEAFRDRKPDNTGQEFLLQKICPGNKVLSIYPVEYSRKALSREKTFRSLMVQINAQENQLGELRGMMRKSLFNQ